MEEFLALLAVQIVVLLAETIVRFAIQNLRAMPTRS
jgi:hypothetical protein